MGGRVEFALSENGLTPTSAAPLIGCTREAILQWIDGSTKNIKNELLFALADLTKFEARWIATGSGNQRSVKPIYDTKIQTVVLAMEKMTEYRKDDLVKISNTFAQPDGENGPESSSG